MFSDECSAGFFKMYISSFLQFPFFSFFFFSSSSSSLSLSLFPSRSQSSSFPPSTSSPPPTTITQNSHHHKLQNFVDLARYLDLHYRAESWNLFDCPCYRSIAVAVFGKFIEVSLKFSLKFYRFWICDVVFMIFEISCVSLL